MTTLTGSERLAPQLAPDAAIYEAGLAHGISLDADRLQQLVHIATSIHRLDSYPDAYKPETVFTDPLNDVSVSRAKHSDRYGAVAAKVDFTPIFEGDGDLVSGAASARPDQATLVALKGVRGLQNYVLLVNAGIAEKPGVLFNDTNPEIAIAAERVGMLSDIARQKTNRAVAHKKMRQVKKLGVSGSFDEVSEHVFSRDAMRLEQILSQRIAALALSS